MATEGMQVTEAGGRGYRVMAVEPDHRFRTRLTVALAGAGVTVQPTLDALLEGFESSVPVVAVFGPSLANETGLAHAQRLTRHHPEVGIVLAAEELSTPLLQQALRAGVRDAIVLENDGTQLRQAVERVGETMRLVAGRTAAEPADQGRVLVAFSTKGGVGKSVVATNLGAVLAARGRRAVVVDADLQFGDVAVLLGVPPSHTVVDAAAAIADADTVLVDSLLGTHERSGMRVLAAPVEPSTSDQVSPDEMVAIVKFLRRMFEFVIVDMPPHFDDLVLALLEEADEVLLVASMDIPSIKNLKVGIQTLDLLAVAGDKLRLVLNRANAKVNLDVGDVERTLGVPAEFRIPSDIAVPQSVNRGVPVVIDKPRSAAALAFEALAAAYLGDEPEPAPTPEPRRRWRRSDREAGS